MFNSSDGAEPTDPFSYLPTTNPRWWSLQPIEWFVLAAVGLAALLAWLLPLTPAETQQILLLLVAVAASCLLFFHWILPRYGLRPWVHVGAATGTILALAWAFALLSHRGMPVDLFFVVVVVIAGIMSGWPLAVYTSLLAASLEALVLYARSALTWPTVVLLLLQCTMYLVAGYLASFQARVVRDKASEAMNRSKDLALLLETSQITVSSLDLTTILLRLAEKVATALPATYCRICLLNQHQHTLVTHGVHPLRPLGDWAPSPDVAWALQDLPRLRAATDNARTVVLRLHDVAETNGETERSLLFPEGVKSVCLVPIVAGGMTQGVIIVGEARNWQREPLDERKLKLLQTLAAQLGIVIQNVRLHQTTDRQRDRFAVLVEVARAVGSTLNLNELLELVRQQLDLVIPSDTYFVALYDETEGMFDLRILIDGGQRFPRQQVPLGEGLATWVILKRQPLLVRHLSEELDSLPVKPMVVGQEKRSESWLGVPMMIGEMILGLLAVASYRPHAFDEEDMALLGTVAQQAALALDNARHHAQVQDQARRDSLTGVYNHGYLLTRLREEVEQCRRNNKPVSLIMLDIDRFKLYNDQYGHTVGDDVLTLTAQAVKTHIKHTDVVGRWGGEEFAVVLPGATTVEAQSVAERIRRTLATLPLTDTHGTSIAKPTVSQGIATLPDHVSAAEDLVVLADRMLYQAKAAGRDQIRVATASP